MCRHRFITATDTGVGKTVVTAGLTILARRNGVRAVAMKPVETGCLTGTEGLIPADGEILQQAGGMELTLDECVPYRFSLPASPYRAAIAEGKTVSMADLEQGVRDIADRYESVMVEGAGGLLVPIEEDRLLVDLVKSLAYPAIVVGRTGLGTINHTLMTVEAMDRRGIEPAGVLLCATRRHPGPEERFTPGDLAKLLAPLPVVTLPYLGERPEQNPEAVADHIEANVPKDAIDRLIGPFCIRERSQD